MAVLTGGGGRAGPPDRSRALSPAPPSTRVARPQTSASAAWTPGAGRRSPVAKEDLERGLAWHGLPPPCGSGAPSQDTQLGALPQDPAKQGHTHSRLSLLRPRWWGGRGGLAPSTECGCPGPGVRPQTPTARGGVPAAPRPHVPPSSGGRCSWLRRWGSSLVPRRSSQGRCTPLTHPRQGGRIPGDVCVSLGRGRGPCPPAMLPGPRGTRGWTASRPRRLRKQGRPRTRATTPPSGPRAHLPFPLNSVWKRAAASLRSRHGLLSLASPRLARAGRPCLRAARCLVPPPLPPLPAASPRVGNVPCTPSRVELRTHLFPSM